MGHKNEAPMVCEHCGTVAAPIKRKPGHTAISVVILLFALIALFAMPVVGVFFVLGWIGYGIYRLAATKVVCSSCGRHDTLLSPDSPSGKKVVSEFASPKVSSP